MDSLECQAKENGIKLKGNMWTTKYLFLFHPIRIVINKSFSDTLQSKKHNTKKTYSLTLFFFYKVKNINKKHSVQAWGVCVNKSKVMINKIQNIEFDREENRQASCKLLFSILQSVGSCSQVFVHGCY